MKKTILAALVVLALSPALYADLSGQVTLVAADSSIVGWVDYHIYAPGEGPNGSATQYLYLYQLESNTGSGSTGLDHLTIDTPYASSAGWVPGEDFDTFYGTAATAAHEGAGATGIDPVLVDYTGNVSWSWGTTKVNAGEESSTLWLLSDRAEFLVKVEALDGVSGAGLIPAPGIPAPGAALLVGLGLGLVGWLKRRVA